MTKKLILKLLLFSLGLLQIIYYLTVLFSLKDYPLPPNVNELISPYILAEKQDGFYSKRNNSLDVVFIGSSNIHCDINPNVIWDRFGITSYDFSCDQQELGTTYYYLKQVFESQSPKVVFIDIFNGGENDELETLQAHFAFDHMKNDKIKLEAIWNRTKKDRLEIFFPLITYHERWKELTPADFRYRPNQHNILNGSLINIVPWGQDAPEIPENIPQRFLHKNTIHWIKAIRQICEENNCECIFIKTPLAFYHEPYFSYYDAFESYCDENNIPFLNFNNMIEEVGLVFADDYTDNVHMNWDGQVKFSSFLGKYIQENFQIENKKGRPEYAQWDEDYKSMMYYIENFWELYNKKHN